MRFFIDFQDKRNITVGEILKKNYIVYDYEKDKKNVKEKDVIVFSPAKVITRSEAESFPNDVKIFCGKISQDVQNIFYDKNVCAVNLLEDEVFAVKNAFLTAEGVLSLIISEQNKSLNDCKILFLGGGRITKATCSLMPKGVNTSVASFSKTEYYNSFYYANNSYFADEFVSVLSSFDVIVNTRPFLYFTEEMINQVKKGALFMETASVECLQKEKVKDFTYLLAPKLPQRFSPYSAGKIIAEKIIGEI